MSEEADDENNFFEVEIVQYTCVGDPMVYADHIYKVRVCVGPRIYAVTRSYVGFCELDAQLRRKYPRSNIPIIPLAASRLFTGKGFEHEAQQDVKTSALEMRASMTMRMSALDSDMTPSKKPKVIRRSDESENISKTKDALNSYLKDLVQLPEVIVSENIISFFDEESVDGEIVKPSQEVSDVDILISGESRKSKTILRHFKVKKDIEAGEVVIWEFSTKYYDIGFSVTFNGSEVVAFQRHNSHVKPVRGCLELSEDGNLELIWDNTYSKMRSKQISYIVHVVSKMEFVTARSFAIEASKERFQYAQQRAQLKKVLMRVSRESMTPQATLAASTTEDVDEATRYRVKGVDEELAKLRNEKKSLQLALAAAEAALVTERTAFAEYMGRAEHENFKKEMALKDLDAMKQELALLSGEGGDRDSFNSRSNSKSGANEIDFDFSSLNALDIAAAMTLDAFVEDKPEQPPQEPSEPMTLELTTPLKSPSQTVTQQDAGDGADGDAKEWGIDGSAFFQSPFDDTEEKLLRLREEHEELKKTHNKLLEELPLVKRDRKLFKRIGRYLLLEGDELRKQLETEIHEKMLVMAERQQLAKKLDQMLASAQASAYFSSSTAAAGAPTTSIPSSSSAVAAGASGSSTFSGGGGGGGGGGIFGFGLMPSLTPTSRAGQSTPRSPPARGFSPAPEQLSLAGGPSSSISISRDGDDTFGPSTLSGVLAAPKEQGITSAVCSVCRCRPCECFGGLPQQLEPTEAADISSDSSTRVVGNVIFVKDVDPVAAPSGYSSASSESALVVGNTKKSYFQDDDYSETKEERFGLERSEDVADVSDSSVGWQQVDGNGNSSRGTVDSNGSRDSVLSGAQAAAPAAPESAPAMSPSMVKINTLIAMGFSQVSAVEALDTAKGDMNLATSILVGERQNSTEKTNQDRTGRQSSTGSSSSSSSWLWRVAKWGSSGAPAPAPVAVPFSSPDSAAAGPIGTGSISVATAAAAPATSAPSSGSLHNKPATAPEPSGPVGGAVAVPVPGESTGGVAAPTQPKKTISAKPKSDSRFADTDLDDIDDLF